MMPELAELFLKSAVSFGSFKRLDPAMNCSQCFNTFAQNAFPDFDFQVTTGSRYPGGLSAKIMHFRMLLHGKAKAWEEVMADLASVAPSFSQAAYSGLQKYLPQE